MSNDSPTIEYRQANSSETRTALSLVLGKVAPTVRGAIVDSLSRGSAHRLGPLDALIVAVSDNSEGEVQAAIWAQPQSGNAATFWPSEFLLTEETEQAKEVMQQLTEGLLCIAVEQIDRAGVATSQIMFDDAEDLRITAFEKAGFQSIAELHYLGCVLNSPEPTSINKEEAPALIFEPYDESQYRRLTRLIEATYEQSLDCPALTGQRSIHDTLTGYQSTGNYHPENWFFVQNNGEDIGVLILAEHELGENYELVYMGLKPSARGKRFAGAIVGHAIKTAADKGAGQLMVAVDALNIPAKRAYETAGFLPWAKRWAYVRTV